MGGGGRWFGVAIVEENELVDVQMAMRVPLLSTVLWRLE